ncbi:TRIM24 [Branchiostoma lanceolatum]|uniref:TRIM24 protein n=1 Tax=Branchiostoma lanceolatum TaxID=7740 RepID=A0A8J9Z3S2_BRALA|nr:TRIM24 [Branchiostoma lanceolatum]
MHARPAVPPTIRHRPVVTNTIQPGPRMHRTIQPKPAFVAEPRISIPTGVPHMNAPTSGAAQLTHVCSRHPGMLVQWVDIASRAGLCTKCLEGNLVQNRSTIYRLEQLMAEPAHGHNIVQTCQKHLGLPLIWYSKTQNKLLCPKCCEEGAANKEAVLSYGGIHDEMWRSYKQLKVWEERANVARQLISNTQEQLETNIRGMRGSVRMCLRNILSEVVAKLKKREESLMIQAGTEFLRQQQELSRLQSAVMASQQANTLAQQLVSHTMLLGPCNQKFCELMEKVQDEMEKAAAADILVPTEITLPVLPPFTLDQGPVNELLLMADSLGSCSHQPPPAAPQLLMHTQGAQVLLRWRWISGGAAGAGRCEFELQCAILPIMVSRISNQGPKSATASTSNQAGVSTPDQQTDEDPNKTTQDDVTIQSRYTGSMGGQNEPSSGKGSKTAEELDTQLEKGSQPHCTPRGSVNTPDTVATPVRQGNMVNQSTFETTLTSVIAETIEACLAEKPGPVQTLDIRQPDNEKTTLMDGSSLDVQLKKQQQSCDAKESEIPEKIDEGTVTEGTCGTRDAEEREVTVVLEKGGDKDAVADVEMPDRKGSLPCTCSDLSAISICPAHFKLHLSSDETSSRSSGSPVQISLDHTTKQPAPLPHFKLHLSSDEASSRSSDSPVQVDVSSDHTAKNAPAAGSPPYKDHLVGSEDSYSRNGSLEETKKVAEGNRKVEEISHKTNGVEPSDGSYDGKTRSNTSMSGCDDVVLIETTQSNEEWQVCPTRIVQEPVDSVRIVFTGEGNGYSNYRLESSDPNTTKTAGKDNSCAELGKQQQITSGRHASSPVANSGLLSGTVPCRDKSGVEQQYQTFGRDGTKLPDVTLQTATVPSRDEDTRLKEQATPTVSDGTNQSGEKTPADKAQQMKSGTPAVTVPPNSTTGPHSEDTGSEQTKTNNQTPSVPNRSFRTIYIGPAFQHSLLLETSAVERGTQTPEMLAHLWSPRKSPAQQKGKGKRKTVLLDTSGSKMSKMDLPKPSSEKGGGFHSRMHERLLVRANMQGAAKTKKGRTGVSDNKADDPPRSNGNAGQKGRTPKKRKADQDDSVPPKQGKGADTLSDQCREAWQNLAHCTPEKNKPSPAKGNATSKTIGREKTPSLPLECREAWQNLAYGTPENGRRKKTASLSEEWNKSTLITPEVSKASSLKKGKSNRGSDRSKTPLKVRWSFSKTHQPSGSEDALAVIRSSGGSCVSKEDARYAVTAVTNLVDALVSWPIDVEFDEEVDKKGTPSRTPKSTPDRPSSSKRRRRQSDPSPNMKPGDRTPQTPASLKQRRAPDYFEECEAMVRAVFDHPDGKLFQLPVKVKEVPDYYDIVKDPMDLDCIKKRLRELYYIIMPDQFLADMKKVFRNCHLYNKPDSEVGQAGCRLESYFTQLLLQYLPTVSYKPVYKLPPADGQDTEQGSPPADTPVVDREPDDCSPEGGPRSVVKPSVDEQHDVFCVTSGDEKSVPFAAGDVASCHEVQIPGSTQQEESVQKSSVEPQGSQVRSGSVEVQDSPATGEVADVSQYANGGAFPDPATALGTATMSESEEISSTASSQESSERNTTFMRIGEAIHTNKEDEAEPDVSQRVDEEKSGVDGTGTESPTESAKSVMERNLMLDSDQNSATDKPAAQGKKQRERKDKPCERTSDEESGTLEPWLSYRGEFAVISSPADTNAAEQVTDSAPQCGSLQPFRSLSSPSLTIVCDEGDAVLCRSRQRSISAVDAAQNIPVRPTNPSLLPNVNNQRRQMASTTLRSPDKDPVIASYPSSSPLQDQVTVLRSNLQAGDATGSRLLPSLNKAFSSGQEMAQVDVVGVLVSENPTVERFQEQSRVDGLKSSRTPSREDLGSDIKTTVDLAQKGQPLESSTKPKRSQKARKSFPRPQVTQKKQIHTYANRAISCHFVSGDEQRPMAAQLPESSAKFTDATAADAPVLRKDAPLFAGKGRRRSTARKSIRMKVTDNPHLRDLDSPQSQR